jgi:hypothetical protein
VASQKAKLHIRDRSRPDKDQLKWKWSGAATTMADFGAPPVDTDYQLCIYDGTSALISRATAPAGGNCAGRACWRETSSRFRYNDKELTPNGVARLLLRQGPDGKARITLLVKGFNMQVPAMPVTQPVTVQLKNGNGLCWEAIYSAPASRNDGGQFSDKSD